MVVLISGCVMMAKGMSDAMYCILTVQGWVHGLLTERRLQRHFPWATPKRWQDLCIPP